MMKGIVKLISAYISGLRIARLEVEIEQAGSRRLQPFRRG